MNAQGEPCQPTSRVAVAGSTGAKLPIGSKVWTASIPALHETEATHRGVSQWQKLPLRVQHNYISGCVLLVGCLRFYP